MKPSSIVYALVWKEMRVVMPLALGVMAIAAILFAVTCVANGDRDAYFFSYLILFPNLVAFGVSALQVGHEDETGTLHWQRSLPVSVSKIVFSKLAVALFAVCCVWLTCLFGYLIAWSTGNISRAPEELMWSGISPAQELFRFFCFTLMLLASSLFTSWLVRSPVAGLLLGAALIAVLTIIVNVAIDTIDTSLTGYRSADYEAAWAIVLYVIFSGVLILLARECARLRWLRNSVFVPPAKGERGAYTAYVPVAVSNHSVPGLRTALLWQNIKQARGIYVAAGLIMMAWIFLEVTKEKENHLRYDAGSHNILIAAIGGLLGVSTFVGDNVRQRYRFLSERGLSALTLWWTRMLPPTVLLVAVSVIAMFVFESFNRNYANRSFSGFMIVSWGAFALGSLSSQWARRPVVGYAATPLLLVIATVFCAFVFTLYPGYEICIVTGVAVLAACTLRMTRRWSEGDQGAAYHGRFIGWYSLAALLVITPIVAYRLWTMPPAMPDWRANTFAEASKLEFESDDVSLPQIVPLRVMYVDATRYQLTDDSINRLKEAIKDMKRGESVMLDHSTGLNTIAYLLGSTTVDASQFYETNEVTADDVMALTFSTIEALSGKPLSLFMSQHLDQIELTAAQALGSDFVQKELGEERIRDYAGRLRTPAQRREDRRSALLLSWAVHNSDSPSSMGAIGGVIDPKTIGNLLPTNAPKLDDRAFSFGGYNNYLPSKAIISYERDRNLRLFDLATKLSLDRLNQPSLPPKYEVEESNVDRPLVVLKNHEASIYWSMAFDDSAGFLDRIYRPMYSPDPISLWYSEFETEIERARALAEPTP